MIKTRWLFSAITAVAVAGCGDKGTGEMQSLCSEDGSTAPVDFRIGSRTELDRVVATVAACPGISFGSLTIADSDDLEHVDGLGQLAYLDGDLIIRNNAALSDLEGLARLEGIDPGDDPRRTGPRRTGPRLPVAVFVRHPKDGGVGSIGNRRHADTARQHRGGDQRGKTLEKDHVVSFGWQSVLPCSGSTPPILTTSRPRPALCRCVQRCVDRRMPDATR